MIEVTDRIRRELQASAAERREAHDREVQKALTALRESLGQTCWNTAGTEKPVAITNAEGGT